MAALWMFVGYGIWLAASFPIAFMLAWIYKTEDVDWYYACSATLGCSVVSAIKFGWTGFGITMGLGIACYVGYCIREKKKDEIDT